MMPTDFAFRFSTYLTLALACACLGEAELDYLPEVTAFTGVIVALMVVSFFTEGRFALTLTAANLVGAGIFVVAAVWIAIHWRRPDSLIHTLPWPAGLLPYITPVLTLAMAAKLFRPKHTGDWWAMHGLGLSSVALAGSLADDGWFVALFILYAVAGVWSLSVFFQRRNAGLIPPVPPTDTNWLSVGSWFPWLGGRRGPPPVIASASERWHRVGGWQARRPLGWLLVAASVALPLFYLTPRSTYQRWSLGPARNEVGYTPTTSVDVGRSGTLQENNDEAFRVTVTDITGRPKTDLPPLQLWRGASYVKYAHGKWDRSLRTNMQSIFDLESGVLNRRSEVLPDMGPDQYLLEFQLAEPMTPIVLADPVAYLPRQPAPVQHERGAAVVGVTQTMDGSFVVMASERTPTTRYRQVCRPLPTGERGMPFAKASLDLVFDVFADYRERPSPAVESWAMKLLSDLMTSGKLSAGILLRFDPRTLKPSTADHREIARAFCEHFAQGRDYKYSLDRPRKDRTIDPCEDFLFNTKAGHCERFATALAMALRGVGIPCQFVLGFRGAELTDEGYVVRQSHAHAWVEAIVPSTPVGPDERDKRYVWITLDPTPSGDEEGSGSGSFWDAARKTGKQFLTEYVIGLNPSSQKRAAATIRETTTSVGPWLLVSLLLVALIVAVVRRLRAKASGPVEVPVAASEVPWYDRMVGVLTTAGLSTKTGQTPREYASAATAHLSADPRTAAVADTPASVAAAMYEVRYAGVPLEDARLTDLNRAVDELATALSHVERRATL